MPRWLPGLDWVAYGQSLCDRPSGAPSPLAFARSVEPEPMIASPGSHPGAPPGASEVAARPGLGGLRPAALRPPFGRPFSARIRSLRRTRAYDC
jgi:hypothetical protein